MSDKILYHKGTLESVKKQCRIDQLLYVLNMENENPYDLELQKKIKKLCKAIENIEKRLFNKKETYANLIELNKLISEEEVTENE
jgi:hypothetical protein